MREMLLKDINGIRTTFIARVKKFKRANPKNHYVLLTDIRDDQGNHFSTGFWIKMGVRLQRLNIKINDYIEFRARVNGKNSAYPSAGHYLNGSFRLSRPTRIWVLTRKHPHYPKKDPPKEEPINKDLEEKISIWEWI
jgi:hypothetical protein